MARKKKHPEHENHERWLVSYADFITLLFAFFVVMFASSQADKGKAQQVSDSVKKALEGEKMSAVVAAILGGTIDNTGKGNAMAKGPGGVRPITDQAKAEEKVSELMPSMKVLTQALAKQIAAGEIEVNMEKRGLVISFTQAALFPSGEDTIPQSSYAPLSESGRSHGPPSEPCAPRRPHRFAPHQELAIPEQLGALRRPSHRCLANSKATASAFPMSVYPWQATPTPPPEPPTTPKKAEPRIAA